MPSPFQAATSGQEMVESQGLAVMDRAEIGNYAVNDGNADEALSSLELPGWTIDQLDYPTFRIGLVAKIMDRLTIRQLLEQDALTYAEWRVLARIAAMVDGGTAGQVAELAWVDCAEVSRAISALERKGLLARRKNQSDRRTSSVFLTDAGKAQYRETLKRRSSFHEQLLSGLSPEERATLDDLLGRIGTELTSILKNGPAK
ncbi:MAG: MarR family winged helix-turn-helix transcriptional regulator [Sphingobium sp.]